MYEFDTARVYHDFYRERGGKDYAAESAHLASVIRDRAPRASSLLDVACGSGANLKNFSRLFDDVEGLDLSEPMLEVARTVAPDVPLHEGDMCDFALGRRFDAVTCMFSSIGYVGSEARLRQAVACFVRHLEPGGVVLVEPWWTPERFLDRHVAGDVVVTGERTIARVSHTVGVGDVSRMAVLWVVADPDEGIRHVVEQHDLTLFEDKQYEEAFALAGCPVERIDTPWRGPGLYVGVRQG